jgi:hypothetical protein
MRFAFLVASLAVSLLGFCGCDDAPAPAPSQGGAADASKPLEGKAPSGAGQFEGRWVRVGEGDFDAMEFRKDGKAMLGGEGAGITMDYSVLDGGRLSLVAPGGLTTVYDATISGDQLELRSEGNLVSAKGAFRFRRLKKGETVKDALAEQARARAEAFRRRNEAMDAYLKQPDLVLAYADAREGEPGAVALAIKPEGGSFSGQAWHDDRPPHLNAIGGNLDVNEAEQSAGVAVTFGQRISPPATAPDGGGRITMTVEGDGKKMRIAAKVRAGDAPAREMVLRPDPKLHADIVKRYDAELARIEALRQPLIGLLKEYAVLRGQLAPMDQRKAEPDTADLTLARDAKSGQYRVEGVYLGQGGRGELLSNAAAEIVVADDKPLLRVVCPPSREFQLQLPDPKASRLAGLWMPIGSGQGRGAQFEVVEALDAAARDAKFEARRKAFQALSADAAFTGLAHEDSGRGMDMPIPVRIRVTPGPDGSFTGKVEYPSVSTVMTAAGRMTDSPGGPRLQLSFTGAESTPADRIFFRSIQNGTWSLVPADGPGPMKLTGYFNGPPLRAAALTLVNDESLANLRKKLAGAMGGDGGKFLVSRFVGWQATTGWPQGTVPTVVDWKHDDASNKVTGGIVANGRALGTPEQGVTSHEGQLRQENGWVTLEVMQTMPWGANKMVQALKLYACEDGAGALHLSGASAGFPNMPAAQPLPAFPTQFERLVELVPVASTDTQTRGAIDQAVAAVRKATDDATAAREAKDMAAVDARRARLAPFLPMFKSATGLVITSDAPANMGSVILESLVDEKKGTVAGKGIDLREMPFREFTFEAAPDNAGNLTLTTSVSKAPYAFPPPKDNKVAAGRSGALAMLSDADRANLDRRIELGKRLQGAAPAALTVSVLDAAAAKAREAGLAAGDIPGVVIYRERRNDQVAAMFTAKSRGRYRWAKESVSLRLAEPMKGKGLYIKNGGPTDNLTVVVNGVHRATIPAIPQLGAAVVDLPADLEIYDIRLDAGGTAQPRGVVMLK